MRNREGNQKKGKGATATTMDGEALNPKVPGYKL